MRRGKALRDAMAKLEPKVEVALESIKVTEPDKTEYVEGETGSLPA